MNSPRVESGVIFLFIWFYLYNGGMMNENYNTPNSGCCGRPFPTAPENKCKYNDWCMNEYAYKQKACIRNKQPDCETQAVIPSITVETVDGISNLANCLVHVTSTNTTYYVDDKHRILITWAGPVNIPGYDMEANPNHYKNQIVTDTQSETAVIYDNNGNGYIFGITPENLQQAVDDKLNEMVADGTLQDILLNYTTVSKVYNTTREMLADADNLVVGEKVHTLGYYTLNDGGGSEFVITNATTTSYQINLGGGKYATLISRNINVDQLGANGGNKALSAYFDTLENAQEIYPNATSLDEYVGGVAIQCAIDYFYNRDIYFNANVYYSNTELVVTDGKRIHFIGTNFGKSIIKRIDEGTSDNNHKILNLLRTNSSTIKNVIENIDFVGPHTGDDTTEETLNSYHTIGIDMVNSSYNVIRNCTFMYLKSGIHAHYSWTNIIENCYFDRNNNGIDTYSSSEFNDVEMNHCYFVHNNRGLYLGQGRSQLVINCDIENNNLDGLRRTNSGDIQIINTYFEDKIFIPTATSSVGNILIIGCSFYQNSNSKAFYVPITYDGEDDATQVTVMNCNFIDGNGDADYSSHYAIREYSGSGIKPALINNSVTRIQEFNPSSMRGMHIKNGILRSYYRRSFATNYINASDGGEKVLDYNAENEYRLNLMASGSYTIKLPNVNIADRFVPQKFTIVVGPNNDSGRLGTVSLSPVDSSTCEVSGHTTISISDINKLITATYVGNFNSKDNWVVAVSA